MSSQRLADPKEGCGARGGGELVSYIIYIYIYYIHISIFGVPGGFEVLLILFVCWKHPPRFWDVSLTRPPGTPFQPRAFRGGVPGR